MTRKFKTLGVALVAVFALTAVMASAASAATYTSSTYPTTGTALSEVGNDVFTTEGGTVECRGHFHATLGEAKGSLEVTPTYTNCKAFGFVNAEVTGCVYEFTATSQTSSDVHIINPCTIKASTCHVTVDKQGPLSHVGTTNNPGGDVSILATVKSIKYTVITDGFLCPFNGTGEKLGATYNQGAAVTFDAVSPASATISVS